MVGELSWGWIRKNHVQVQKEERKFRGCLVTPSTKLEIRNFHIVIVQSRKKKCAVRVVLLTKPIAVLMFSLPSPSSYPKVLNVKWTVFLGPFKIWPRLQSRRIVLSQEAAHVRLLTSSFVRLDLFCPEDPSRIIFLPCSNVQNKISEIAWFICFPSAFGLIVCTVLDVSCVSGDNDFLQYFIFRNLDQLVCCFVFL